MRLKGHSQQEISKALEVASAAEALFESGFTKGFERFDAVRAKYRKEPWYKDLHGNYTYFILPYTAAELREQREQGKAFVFGRPFGYDPMPTLELSKRHNCGFSEKTISKRQALRQVAVSRC